ncbi:MAG: transcription-repair coupling factor [Lachnospiraceae bacterium]|nr:transcription-repair coupling factor [Lachnospiraceae bacterium]
MHKLLSEIVQFQDAAAALASGRGPVAVSGCVDTQKTHLAQALTEGFPLRLFVTYSETRAREILDDLSCFISDVYYYPAKDVLFYQADIQGSLLARERMAVIAHILEEKSGMVVTTIDALMDMIASPDDVYRRLLVLMAGESYDQEEIKQDLVSLGYERETSVERAGQFAIRGGIMDIFPLTEENPVRIEFFGDEIDSIRTFSVETQRSMENLNMITVYASDEMPPVHDGKYVSPVSFLQYFNEAAAVILDEPANMKEMAEGVYKEFHDSMDIRLSEGVFGDGPVPQLITPEETFKALDRKHTLMMTGLPVRNLMPREQKAFEITGKTMVSYAGNMDGLKRDLKGWKNDHYRIMILCGTGGHARRIAENLRDYELPAVYKARDPEARGAEEVEVNPGQIIVTTGSIHKSFEYPQIRYAVLSEGDLFGREKKKKKRKSRYSGTNIKSYEELTAGDYVVHESHGLGQYKGLEKIEVGGIIKDYLKITYSDGGNLYVPVTQMDVVKKYASSDTDRVPRLNKLAGNEWNKTRTRVRHAVKDIAKDLVALYARRQNAQGFKYSQDTVWQTEFEEQFPFEETEDQLRAIGECKADMESGRIMDRLICGDVGYGKTEIALRAAFKAVQDGKQVAYLAPTTILAQQHYNTFAQRMKDYPVGVELLCRFRTQGEQKASLEKIRRGISDIAIGTHRLLSKDVEFKDLGLLIIDEEQRFGVADKEKIKKLKENVNVMSLTATPIPRTLHMSLIGIRDMSILHEPPLDRLPIQTYVMEYNDELVREAIQRELSRGGQVYYVYNRVRTIRDMALKIAALVPDANVVFAHGQMKERELEKIMMDFVSGEIDVLVSTTIIETGLDIPNVNTIIVHDADRFGLSQLYQLRGRVGRSSRRASAFLMYRRDRVLKEVAQKRLTAVREYTELGSGIKIAMRDLELRGAGNLLGAEQHGHMEAVGYELYVKMLSEAVKEAKGDEAPPDFDTSIELDMDAYIPDGYIADDTQRMDMYRRIAGMENAEDYDDILDELTDRYSDPPGPVINLLEAALIRSMAKTVYVTEISGNRNHIRFSLFEKAGLSPEKIPAFVGSFDGDMKLLAGNPPGFMYRDQRGRIKNDAGMTELVKNVLNRMKILLEA